MAVSRYKAGINIASGGHAGFTRWLLLSAAIHIVLAILIILSPARSRELYSAPVYEVELLPMPETAEPEKPQQKQEAMPPKEPIKQKVKPKVKKELAIAKTKKEKAGYDEAVAKLREKVIAEDAVEKIRKRIKNNKEAVDDKAVKIADRAPKKVYHYEELDKELQAYYDKIALLIRNAWSLPESLRNKSFVTELSVQINRDGTIQSLWIDKRSGNKLYDESTIRAINKLSSLPPLPKGWKGERIDLGFTFP